MPLKAPDPTPRAAASTADAAARGAGDKSRIGLLERQRRRLAKEVWAALLTPPSPDEGLAPRRPGAR